MKSQRKFWLIIIFLFFLGLIVVSLKNNQSAILKKVTISFIGYTNLPANNERFALFCISNQISHSVRWHDAWVEVEGNPDHKARITNHNLPGYTYNPQLNSGSSQMIAVGEPFYADEHGRWKFVMEYSQNTIQERWFFFASQRHLPLQLGPIIFADSQRILNPTNYTVISSSWLVK